MQSTTEDTWGSVPTESSARVSPPERSLSLAQGCSWALTPGLPSPPRSQKQEGAHPGCGHWECGEDKGQA